MARRSLIHEVEARERRGRWFPAFAGLLAIALLASSWVGLFSFMSANAAFGTFTDLQREYIPDTEEMPLSLPDLSQVSRVFASGGELLAELHDGRNQEPVAIDQVPERVRYAVLAAEDRDFYEHEGIDFQAIASAALDNLLSDSIRGGSTITQQVVKNYFVGNEVSIRRKINEAFVAAEVERRFTKDQILEFYMNSVYFGSGAYGIKAAAREFYGKELHQLTVDEAATLAVQIRSPSLYNPRKRPELVRDRRDQVIDIMLEEGWITASQATTAKAQPIDPIPHVPAQGIADHVVAEVKRQLLNDPEFAVLGETREERKWAVFGCSADDTTCTGGGGLRIHTTINLWLQNEANRILQEWMPVPPYDQNLELCRQLFPNESEEFLAAYAERTSCAPTGAIASVDNRTGAVKVMASGLPFDVNQFDLAVQGRRNPGSAFKPFGLVAALENGITLESRYDAPAEIDIECPHQCSELGNIWRVRNAGGGDRGVITLEQATYGSVNTVYAQVSQEVGPQKIVDVAHRMGITAEVEPALSVVLGAGAVSPLEMASAYSNFATNGAWAEPYLIERIETSDGEVIYQRDSRITQVGDPALFAAARRPLERVPTSAGTAPRANIGRPQGGKTGTHQAFRDAWYVGFVPEFSTAVWVGFAAEQVPLQNVVIRGERYSRVYGGTVPAPIWGEFMQIMLAGTEPSEFPPDPEGVERYIEAPNTKVPLVVGLTQEEAEQRIRRAKLVPAVEPVASPEPPGTVVAQSLDPNAEVAQGTTLIIRVASGAAPTGELPYLIGMTVEQALAQIRTFEQETGLRLTVVRSDYEVDDPNQVGLVVGTNPGPQTPMQFGDIVTLFVGK